MTDPTDQPADLVRVLNVPALALRAVAVDFDGVIHAYRRGVQDGTCYDDPMPGALDAVRRMARSRPVAVMTARPIGLVAGWFDQHAPDIPLYLDPNLHREWWDELGTLLVTNRKIMAQHYIDDRAIRFGIGRRAMAADWDDVPLVLAYWDHEYRERYARRATEAEPCE
jgi:hypothetical protein